MRFSTTPNIAGNLSVKTKAAHINPGALGAPEITKLERWGHFAQRNVFSASIWSKIFFRIEIGQFGHNMCVRNVSNCDKHNSIETIWGNPLPESCVMLFTTLCTGWILKARTRQIFFSTKCQKSEIGEKSVYIPP